MNGPLDVPEKYVLRRKSFDASTLCRRRYIEYDSTQSDIQHTDLQTTDSLQKCTGIASSTDEMEWIWIYT